MGKAVTKRAVRQGRGGFLVSIGTGHDPVEPGPEEPERPGKKWTLAISCLIAVFVVLGIYAVASGVAGSNSGTSASSTKSAPGSTSASATQAGSASASTTAPASLSSPQSPASSPRQHALSIASATAFGPDGTSDGDNPEIASRVIGGSAQPWYSSWYTTPEFGNLQAGTGLLLDMGNAVSISSVQLVLGSPLGAYVQVRVGNVATLPDLSTVATATNVGGIVQLPTKTRASGRYVLIWFTALPPNGLGKYQIEVYSTTVDGTAGA
jgi:eukaryotic-like serine/threonine-protein kinase